MNRIEFGGDACERTRRYLDSYISNELAVETNHEVLGHLESCATCAAELDSRTRLRSRLKAAVTAQNVPPELQVRIREQIRNDRSRGWFGSWFRASLPLAMAVTASVALCVGVWNYSRQSMPALSDRTAQNAYIQKVSATLASVLRVGLGDHIHCSVFRKYPQNPPPVEKMEADLGPAYKGLLPIVRAAVPGDFKVVMAHRCGYAGRKFIHLTLEKNGDRLSLVVAQKKDGESLNGLPAASTPAGIPVVQAGAGRYQVAGFDAGGFLAYVVSDLKSQSNLRIASNLAPGVSEFLMKTPA